MKKKKKNSGLNGIRTHDLCKYSVYYCKLCNRFWLAIENQLVGKAYLKINQLVKTPFHRGCMGIARSWCNCNDNHKSYLSPQFKYMIFHKFIYSTNFNACIRVKLANLSVLFGVIQKAAPWIMGFRSTLKKTPPANELLDNVSDGIISERPATLNALSPGADHWSGLKFAR